MTTGIQGALAVSSSLTYTPANNAKVTINGAGTSTTTGIIQVNGVTVLAFTTSASVGSVSFYVGANQTVTITTNATATALVSSIESS